MTNKSKGFLGDVNVEAFKLGDSDVKVYLGDMLVYPLNQCGSSGESGGYEYVDLCLPSGTLWATKNVGASSETDYGNYYKWGYGADTFQVTSGQSCYSDAVPDEPLVASADTAIQTWGGQWHMPTAGQLGELASNTTFEWTTINGINGGKFTSQNGNYVFFPAAGYYNHDGTFILDGTTCSIISSIIDGDGRNQILVCSDYNGGTTDMVGDMYGCEIGLPVRPVIGTF